MTRIMYDSTTPWDIPRNAEMVAYYVDGRYAWPQAWLDLFPHAVKVSISAVGARVAQVGDVEVGCIWPPANAVPWVRRARAAGIDPTIYCNELNDWLPVRRAFWAAGEPEPHYWVARYNGVAQIPNGAVARQYKHPHDGDGVADKPWETGAHYDESIVVDYWPGVDARPPGGGGGLREELGMGDFLVRDPADGECSVVTISATTQSRAPIRSPEILAVFEELMGTKVRNVSTWAYRYLSIEPGPGDPVDEQEIIEGVNAGLIPMVLKAIEAIDIDGMTFDRQVEAVREALRRGAGS